MAKLYQISYINFCSLLSFEYFSDLLCCQKTQHRIHLIYDQQLVTKKPKRLLSYVHVIVIKPHFAIQTETNHKNLWFCISLQHYCLF